MKLGRAGLVTAICWSAIATIFASCSDNQETSGSGQTGLTSGVPGGTGASGPSGSGVGGSSGDPRIDYCKDITKYCIDDPDLGTHNQMYLTESNCRDIALLTPEGQPADSVGNTIGCRRHYLQFAMDDPDLNCRPAGPASFEDKCGTSCEDFCSLAAKICTGDQAQWPTENACKQDCNKWSNLVPYYITAEGGPEGNNFACRLFQLVRSHCGSIGVESDACVDPVPRDGGMGGMGGGGGAGGAGGAGGGMVDAGDPDAADSGG